MDKTDIVKARDLLKSAEEEMGKIGFLKIEECGIVMGTSVENLCGYDIFDSSKKLIKALNLILNILEKK